MSAYTELQPANFRGEVDGRASGLYTLSNSRGMTVRFTTLGAKVMQIVVPDRHGEMAQVGHWLRHAAVTVVGASAISHTLGKAR